MTFWFADRRSQQQQQQQGGGAQPNLLWHFATTMTSLARVFKASTRRLALGRKTFATLMPLEDEYPG